MIQRLIQLPKKHSFFLFGPRQTGKSTLLKTLFSEQQTMYYDLLKSEEYLRLSAHPQLFREEVLARPASKSRVIIDEIQRVPLLLNEVHWLMEQPRAPVFLLTGSSARKLKRGHANLLGGRALTMQLFPLVQAELTDLFSLHKALEVGTLPKIYLEPERDVANALLQAYVDTYLKEEIQLEAQVRNLNPFIQFLTLAAHENGNSIHFSNISRETGVSYQTVKSYYQILEDTLLGFFLLSYKRALRKRLNQHPKFYFFDRGIVRALTKTLTVPLEPKTDAFGRAFEHFMILEIMRTIQYEKLDYRMSYYRTEHGAEVDLILETPRGGIKAIEIKSTDSVQGVHLSGLRSFATIAPHAELCCASLAPHRRKIGNIDILPWQDVLEWIKR
ncbi:MAG: ATP-binding protein [Candidatus Kerfeldbacteria bacterium]|nr:ATP-binding protein [Candidatus Kerfeldbacteria bacterium]